MNALQIVMKTINPISLCMGFSSVCVGSAASSIHGYFQWFPFVLCVIYACLIQATGNIGHRYYDEKYGYGENIRDGITNEDEDGHPIIFVLNEGVKVFYLLSITVGIAIMIFCGWWAIIPGILIMLINRLNNHGKHPWSHEITYPLITFLLFGPICVISTSLIIIYFETGVFPIWTDIKPSIVLSVVMGLLAMNSHIIHRTSQELDGTFIYNSITAKFGLKTTTGILLFTTIAANVILAFSPMAMEVLLGWGFLAIPAISLIFGLYTTCQLYMKKKLDLLWTIALINILFVGITLFILFWYSGYPNFSHFDDAEIIYFL